ncbi:MAG: 4Fe-4S binding protein [Oscillospiraceae bacterium]|nr:4Fe-4S binding protein [Oscillospiraceae bacterium]
MKNSVIVDEEVCKGCGLCAFTCPKKIMELDRSRLNGKGYHAAVCTDLGQCIACAMCAVICPDSAITVTKEG